MNTRDILFPIILIPVVVFFGLISALVLINNGKNAKLIAAKLRVGAFLLSFSWFAVSCTPTVECYATAMADQIIMNNGGRQSLKPGDTIAGNIKYPNRSVYNYTLTDTLSGVEVQNGAIPNNSNSEKDLYFEIILNDSLSKGGYYLDFFSFYKDTARENLDRFFIIIE